MRRLAEFIRELGVEKSFDKRGREVSDSTPVEVPLNFKRPETIQEQIKRMVRQELSQVAAAAGAETFQEADDFDVEEEDDPVSRYEMTPMQEEAIARDASDLETPPPPPKDPPAADPPAPPPPGGSSGTVSKA